MKLNIVIFLLIELLIIFTSINMDKIEEKFGIKNTYIQEDDTRIIMIAKYFLFLNTILTITIISIILFLIQTPIGFWILNKLEK